MSAPRPARCPAGGAQAVAGQRELARPRAFDAMRSVRGVGAEVEHRGGRPVVARHRWANGRWLVPLTGRGIAAAFHLTCALQVGLVPLVRRTR